MASVRKYNGKAGWIDAHRLTHLVSNAVVTEGMPKRGISTLLANEDILACFGQVMRGQNQGINEPFITPKW